MSIDIAPVSIERYKLDVEHHEGYIVQRTHEAQSGSENQQVWERRRTLGEGGFGEVSQWRWEDEHGDSHYRAVKVCAKDKMRAARVDYKRELAALAAFSESECAGLFVNLRGWWTDSEKLFVAMEYLNRGDLSYYIGPDLHEADAKEIVRGILQGLDFMHKRGFVHRDIKPQNILVVEKSPKWWVKIADFGLSKRVLEDSESVLHSIRGTRDYCAPEVLDQCAKGAYTNKVDMWSLGCVLFNVSSQGQTAFSPRTLWSYYDGKLPFNAQKAKLRLQPDGLSFITALLQARPEKRLTAAEALDHTWLTVIGSAVPVASMGLEVPTLSEVRRNYNSFLDSAVTTKSPGYIPSADVLTPGRNHTTFSTITPNGSNKDSTVRRQATRGPIEKMTVQDIAEVSSIATTITQNQLGESPDQQRSRGDNIFCRNEQSLDEVVQTSEFVSIHVLVNDYPHRALALSSSTHVLIFERVHSPSRSLGKERNPTNLPLPNAARKRGTPRCLAQFTKKTVVDLKGFRTLGTAKGMLGLITLGNDDFVCVVTGSREVATVQPGETVQRILAVEFFCLNRSDYNFGQATSSHSGQAFTEEEQIQRGGANPPDGATKHPFHALKELLSDGTFYYSLNFDLTRRLQDRLEARNTNKTIDVDNLDQGFLWNSYMISPLLAFRSRLSSYERTALDQSGLLTSVIRGFAQTLTIPPSCSPIRREGSNCPATLTLISRLSAHRAGTRFNSCGVDDNGNVANFVETETLFWSPTGTCSSYVQIRGSVPIFWESFSSLTPGFHKIQFTRSLEATQHSFNLHFESLEKTYGSIHIISLLSLTNPGEAELSGRYREHIKRSSLRRRTSDTSSSYDQLQSTEFDFDECTNQAGGYDGARKIQTYISPNADSFAYFHSDEIEEEMMEDGQKYRAKKSVVIMQQKGVFRVNCLNCNDRTNLIQDFLSRGALDSFLSRGHERGTSTFWLRHSSLWADNGDALSKIYIGTGAPRSGFTRHGKMSFGGLLSDFRKAATRFYIDHFEDKDRQNTVDLLLGRLIGQNKIELFDAVSDWVMSEASKRRNDFESVETIKVWVGTYNLNGKVTDNVDQLRTWLPQISGSGQAGGYELVVVGFQEIVELSPQQIFNTDRSRRLFWENAVEQCLNTKSQHEKHPQDDYILLRSGQLVGAVLMVFIKPSLLIRIKNVEGATKKTGMSGMAGNKGAVAIRMDIGGTSFCFITAHLAAGFGNYEERNRDYSTISSGLRFQRGRSIEDHEYIIWAGDFNYCVGQTYERALNLVNSARKGMSKVDAGKACMNPEYEDAVSHLYKDDQLNIQMITGNCFQFYREGKIKFLPTYRFDLGKDEYDSSEKTRMLAWTGRVLWRVAPGAVGQARQVDYGSVMGVRLSHHKPVFGTFEVDVRRINEQARNDLVKKLYERRLREIRNQSAGGLAGSGDEMAS